MIAPNQRISFEIERSYLCGNEVADVGIIRTTLPGGQHTVVVRGVYTYRSDGHGRIAALRAYWEFDAAEITGASARPADRTRQSRPGRLRAERASSDIVAWTLPAAR